ncbi:hypothetical protein OL229_04465 [Neisseriaceae bacterium JH1-16]|nr:hypothetical protein [Neisseriaceae bacterium JH1-16]
MVLPAHADPEDAPLPGDFQPARPVKQRSAAPVTIAPKSVQSQVPSQAVTPKRHHAATKSSSRSAKHAKATRHHGKAASKSRHATKASHHAAKAGKTKHQAKQVIAKKSHLKAGAKPKAHSAKHAKAAKHKAKPHNRKPVKHAKKHKTN